MSCSGADSGVAGGDQRGRRAKRARGCRLHGHRRQGAEERPDHSVVPTPDASPKWNTSPPTSGPHYGETAVSGAYTEPLNQAQVVHNLEHGGVYIQYGKDVPAGDGRRAAGRSTTATGTATLLAPLPSLGTKIALGVWTTTARRRPARHGHRLPREVHDLRREAPTPRSSTPTSSRARSGSRWSRSRPARRAVRRTPSTLRPVAAGVAKLVIRARLKIGCPSGRLGSTPSPGILVQAACGASRDSPLPGCVGNPVGNWTAKGVFAMTDERPFAVAAVGPSTTIGRR